MQYLADILPFVASEPGTFLAITLSFLTLSLVCHIYQMWQVSRLNKRYRRLLGGLSGEKTLEEILLNYFNNTRLALDKVQDLDGNCQRVERGLKYCVQNIGLVRYNAFPDVAGDLSFALALLDGNEDGVVLSSLYGRNESHIYGKPILRGTSTYHISDEEKAAIARALKRESN